MPGTTEHSRRHLGDARQSRPIHCLRGGASRHPRDHLRADRQLSRSEFGNRGVWRPGRGIRPGLRRGEARSVSRRRRRRPALRSFLPQGSGRRRCDLRAGAVPQPRQIGCGVCRCGHGLGSLRIDRGTRSVGPVDRDRRGGLGQRAGERAVVCGRTGRERTVSADLRRRSGHAGAQCTGHRHAVPRRVALRASQRGRDRRDHPDLFR